MIQIPRKFRSSVLVALLCAGSSVSLLAQGPGGPGGGQHHGPPHNALFDALDTNHDGVLSAEEITNAPTSLKALLKNGATELKREDLRPAHPGSAQNGDHASAEAADKSAASTDSTAAKPEAQTSENENHGHHGPPPNKLFDAIDTNHDGVISTEEMANAPTAIKSLLKNGATELRHEDLRPAHPPQANND